MTTPDWPICVRSGCSGIQVEGSKVCLTHLPPDKRDEFLGGLRPDADLDARGTSIDGDVLARLLVAAPVFGHLNLEKAEFDGIEMFGPLTVSQLTLDGARFERHVQIEVRANWITCVGARFEGGVTLRTTEAAIDATRAIFGPSSSITTSLAFPEAGLVSPPILVSLRGTDVSNLVLVDVNLSACLFVGAHRLDQLRLEDRCVFSSPPDTWRWTRRQVLTEEGRVRGWTSQHAFVPDALPIRWERLAAIYRSLRKAFEDSKNEAGAGDFYYGEMEARRHSEVTPWTERWILAAYWALSGYGQRAGRAVAALGVLVAIVCILLFIVGLPGGLGWSWARIDQSLRIGMGAVVFREAGQTLTSAGSWTVMVARFAGPVLLALALLAVRARVKR